MPTKHVLIKGKVQGVFYRATARDVAQKLGLNGWVKNTDEGHVEAVVSGAAGPVQKFIDWCWKGPVLAHVTAVDAVDIPNEEFTSFTVIRG
jgi:acylphosphatase